MQAPTTPDQAEQIYPRPGILVPQRTEKVAWKLIERMTKDILNAANHPKRPHYIADIVRSWEDSECRLKTWIEKYPIIAGNVKVRRDALWRVDWDENQDGKLITVLKGAFWFDEENVAERANTDKSFACELFGTFLTLAAPLAEIGRCGRCGKFYWNRWGHANKTFCGRRCASIKTALETQRERIANEHRAKTEKIRQAVETFIKEKPRTSGWKEWVAKRAGVTRNYVTHRLNLGSRGEADGLRLTKRQTEFFGRLEKQ